MSSEQSPDRALIEEAPIGIFEVNEAGRYVDVNPAGCEMLGYSREEFLEISIADLAPTGDDSAEFRSLDELRDGGHSRVETALRHKEGHKVEVILNFVALDGDRYVAYAQEITERKEYKTELEQTREELRQIIDLIPDPIFVKNREDKVLLTNEANAELLGSTVDDIEGSLMADVIPEQNNYETLRPRNLEAINSGETTVFEEEIIGDDRETHIFQTTRIPFETTRTAEDAAVSYARDVTDLKKYEQELEQQRDNLEVLNQVVRHDIRNQLQIVLAYGEMLRSDVEEADREAVENLLDAARDAVDITKTARDVTEVMLQSGVDRRAVRLRSLLEGEIEDARSSHDHAVVRTDGSIPDVTLLADDLLASVFRNLLKNAIQHNDKDIPEVTVSATRDDGAVLVRIADNGPGIPNDRKAEIFDQGNRDLDSDGTGLGLYLVDTLVDRYGGDVWIEDNDPDGAVFLVELPIADTGSRL